MSTRTKNPTQDPPGLPPAGGAPPTPPDELPVFDVDEGPMRSELRRQITHLDRELTELAGAVCPWEPRHVNRERGPAVQGGASLEEIRDELLAAIDVLRARVTGMDDAGPPPEEPRGRWRRRGRDA